MTINTLRTSVVFVFTWLDGLLPFSLRRRSLNSIYNFIDIKGLFGTSGQPTENQFKAISQSGVASVLNLAPHRAENALDDEASVVTNLGMRYLHLPVDFKRPSDADFESFCQLVEQHKSESLWIHCAANMRVSAFVYRYRVQVLNELEEVARVDLNKVWEPFGVWRKFIRKARG